MSDETSSEDEFEVNVKEGEFSPAPTTEIPAQSTN